MVDDSESLKKGKNEMKLTDKTAVKLLNKVRCYDLEEDIETYPEEELVGVSDMQILTDEVSWIVSCYYEGGHCLCEDREEALYILRETEYGKKNYIDGLLSGKPSFRYRAWDTTEDGIIFKRSTYHELQHNR